MKNFDYVLARNGAEASRASKAAGTALKAGGTDLVDRMKEGVSRPDVVVNLLGAADMAAGVSEKDGRIRIGALTTLAEVGASPLLLAKAPALVDAALGAATPQLRNRGTVGGNLCQRPRCWYFRNETYTCSKKGGDTCYAADGENKYHAIFGNTSCNIVHPSNLAPALWALDATLEILDTEGDQVTTKQVPIADFWVRPEDDISRENILKPGQVIVSVSIPTDGGGASSFMEMREKESFDWALTSAACRLKIEGGKIAAAAVVVSAVAPVPMRLAAVEALLVGKEPTDAVFRAAGAKSIDGASPLRDNGYKVALLQVTVARALARAAVRPAPGAPR